MKAIIPVAGMGKRLRPHTFITPKVLVNVGGKPMISHIVEKAISSGVDDIAFIIGYKGEMIREYLTAKYDIKLSFYNQEEMLGLAHAVRLADEYLADEPVFIVLGDTIFDVELDPVFKSEYSCLGVKEVEDPRRFGIAELDSEGFITRVEEKPQFPKSNLTLVGLYYFTEGTVLKSAIDELLRLNIKTKDEFQITDAFQILIERGGKLKTFNVDGWYDCGKQETVLSTNRHLLSQMDNKYDIGNSVINPPVSIDESASIENSIIGPYATISKGAKIQNSIIVNSIAGEDSEISDASVKDSIIGNNAIVKGTMKSLNISDYSEIDF